MDHNEALRQQAAEKYVLGELPPTLRDEFEEHFFECQECALDVTAAAGFVDNARAVWRFALDSFRNGGSSPFAPSTSGVSSTSQ